MNAYILSLSNPEAKLDTVGGKGLSLSKMINAGLPVPDGFHITTAAYRDFVEAHDIQSQIMEFLRDADASQMDSLEKVSSRIRKLFTGNDMPQEVSEAVAQAYMGLSSSNQPVAVRSSATAEDLPEASFAGQQETYLNIRGEAAVVDAVRKCWASLWTARAIAYRMKNKVDQKAIALAVVVQELVDAEAAGIMFTTNPVSGKQDEVILNAAWGLGEAIVGGLVSPDTITADKASGAVRQYEIAEKNIKTVRTSTGTKEKPIKGRKRKARVLSDAQVAELIGLARVIENFYGSPQDIEWGLAGQRFFILQARPVTTSSQEMVEADWTLTDPKTNYIRASMAEHIPNAVSPLFSTLGLAGLNASIVELADSMDMHLTDANYMYRVLNGYVYMSYKLSPGFIWEMIKVSLKNFKIMMTQGTERWLEARQELGQVVEKWEDKELEKMPPSEILEGVRTLMYAAGKYYTVIQSGTLPSATTAEMLFSAVYKRIKSKQDPEATQLLLGLDSVALRAEKSLYDLSKWVGGRAALRDYLLQTDSSKIFAAFGTKRAPGDVPAEDWLDFKSRFNDYLQEFGETSYEYDFVNPSPAEMPEPMLDSIKVFLAGKGSSPYQRQKEADDLREKTIAGIMGKFHLIPNRWFKKAYEWALSTAPAREGSLADMGMGHGTVRRYLKELGGRFAKQGGIRAADDIFWLFDDEVKQLTALLEAGKDLPDLTAKAPERKEHWQSQKKLRPPAVLPIDSPFAKMIPWTTGGGSDNELKGVAASAGSVTGTARVLFGPEDFSRMQSGDILVAVTTTPAWTPLFTMASAVVTDIGGPLSHSSIVAREYGIPAVLATGMATRIIRDGQTITVDGSAGLVTLE